MSARHLPSDELARQGVQADDEQNLRLNFGESPIYAHLATLSTALALGGLEFVLKEGHLAGTRLRVVEHMPSGHTRRYRDKTSDQISGSRPINAKTGVLVRGTVQFDDPILSWTHRILSPDIDKLLANGTSRNGLFGDARYLQSSTVSLERPSQVYGVPVMRLGVTAIHSDQEPRLELLNETASTSAFYEFMDMLKEPIKDGGEDVEERGILGTITRTRGKTTITANPVQHFDFHDSLGVPDETLEIARHSFSSLVTYMELPYSLT
jgi:hypothetical protein